MTTRINLNEENYDYYDAEKDEFVCYVDSSTKISTDTKTIIADQCVDWNVWLYSVKYDKKTQKYKVIYKCY